MALFIHRDVPGNDTFTAIDPDDGNIACSTIDQLRSSRRTITRMVLATAGRPLRPVRPWKPSRSAAKPASARSRHFCAVFVPHAGASLYSTRLPSVCRYSADSQSPCVPLDHTASFFAV
jgi:hypothetical protein